MKNSKTPKSITFTMINNIVEFEFDGMKADALLYARLRPVKEEIKRLLEEHAHRERNPFNYLPAVNKPN